MAYEQPNSSAEVSSGIPIVVPVDICGLESCMLQKHGARRAKSRRPELAKNYQYMRHTKGEGGTSLVSTRKE